MYGIFDLMKTFDSVIIIKLICDYYYDIQVKVSTQRLCPFQLYRFENSMRCDEDVGLIHF